MHLKTSLLLTLMGLTSWFACGFSLKPHNYKAFDAIATTHTLPAFSGTKYASAVSVQQSNAIVTRGGSIASAASGDVESSDTSFRKILNTVASIWGSFGVVMILGKSIKRIVPIALEPFNGVSSQLSTFQLGSYIGMCLWFAYVEGYKGFQLKFSPLVVARAQTLKPFTKGSPIHHTIFGPFYAMGLFHATKKRKIVSWSVTIGVGIIVAAVKRLPYPWRNIIDAGVIVGLSWGSLSIITEWIKTCVMGIETKIDPALPE